MGAPSRARRRLRLSKAIRIRALVSLIRDELADLPDEEVEGAVPVRGSTATVRDGDGVWRQADDLRYPEPEDID